MLLSYLKLSLRLLARSPFFTFINVAGLSIGFASFFGLWHYSSTELKSDQYHLNHERIVRLCRIFRWSDDGGKSWGSLIGASFYPKVTHQIKQDMPEVEDYTRIIPQQKFSEALTGDNNKEVVLSIEESDGSKKLFKETKAVYADPNLFDFFSIPLIYGESKNVLRQAHAIVLSEKTAFKYFGHKNPVGELLILNGTTTLKVSGVFQNLPNNTHLDFDMVISNASLENRWNSSFWYGGDSYFRINEAKSIENFEKKINDRKAEYFAELFRVVPQGEIDVFAQPLQQIVFSQDFLGDYFRPKSKAMLVALGIVSVLVLVLAWVNYINLTLARTTKRMREVATRKVAGAKGADFVKQFLIESALINLLAVAIALTLLQVVRTPAQLFLHITAPGWDFSLESITFFSGVVLSGILITGLYPAIMSAKYNPHALFSNNQQQNKSAWPTILTTFQYSTAIGLMLWGFIINLQLNHIFAKEQREIKDPIAIIESPIIRSENFTHQLEYFKDKLVASRYIQEATFSTAVTGDVIDAARGIGLKRSANSVSVFFDTNGGVNENFIPFFGIHLLAGRNFQLKDRADVVIISRFGTERLGFNNPEEAVGTTIYTLINLNEDLTSWSEVEIIGVIEDYRNKPYFSFKESSSEYAKEGRGICLTYKDFLFPRLTPERIAIKPDVQNLKAALAETENIFNEVFPGNVFTSYFLDEHVNRFYNNETVSRNQVIFFTLLTIGIACLGLSGMISNKVVEKTKEIGIRKVLGAQLHQIAQILLSTIVRQIIIATVIGIPVAYYLSQQYLEKFSERITLQWWHFALPVLILVVIMFATIASVLWKAARSNPVEALRTE